MSMQVVMTEAAGLPVWGGWVLLLAALALGAALGAAAVWVCRARRIHALEKECALAQQRVAWAAEQELRRREQESALEERFRSLAACALSENSRELRDANRASMDAVVSPLTQLLSQLKDEVSRAREKNTENTATLNGRIAELLSQTTRIGNDAVELARALKGDSKKRGNWGELVLETILESSGLRKGEQYVLQPSFATEEGRLQPDAVLIFPEGRRLVVDSKVSLVDYDRYVHAADEAARQEALRAHKESMRRHMKSLEGKAYHRLMGDDSPDYVIMFVPIEAAYIAAFHDGSSDLLLEGCRSRVLVVSPTNLIMTLKIALHLWKKQQQQHSVHEIVRLATLVYDKCVALHNHFARVEDCFAKAGESLGKMKNAFSGGRASLIGRVIELKDSGGLQTKDALQVTDAPPALGVYQGE